MHFRRIIQKESLQALLAWVIVFMTWYFFRYQDFSTTALAFKVTLIKVIDLALLVSIANSILVPRFLYKKHYTAFLILFIGMIVASSVIKMYIIGYITNNPALLNWANNWKARVYDNIIPHFFLVVAGTAVRLLIDFIRMQTKMAELAKEKAQAELSFLKSQINPHFLFNTLNTIYFQISKENTEARDTLHKFSEMLRYQVYELNGSPISLEKEVQFLEDYIALQKLRKDDNYRINFDHDDNLAGLSIEPLLLVPLVENAFKHISHYRDQENYIEIKLKRDGSNFYFSVVNSKEAVNEKVHKHGGIGLANIRRRLELVYPGKHKLETSDSAGSYRISLEIILNDKYDKMHSDR